MKVRIVQATEVADYLDRYYKPQRRTPTLLTSYEAQSRGQEMKTTTLLVILLTTGCTTAPTSQPRTQAELAADLAEHFKATDQGIASLSGVQATCSAPPWAMERAICGADGYPAFDLDCCGTATAAGALALHANAACSRYQGVLRWCLGGDRDNRISLRARPLAWSDDDARACLEPRVIIVHRDGNGRTIKPTMRDLSVDYVPLYLDRPVCSDPLRAPFARWCESSRVAQESVTMDHFEAFYRRDDTRVGVTGVLSDLDERYHAAHPLHPRCAVGRPLYWEHRLRALAIIVDGTAKAGLMPFNWARAGQWYLDAVERMEQ